MCALFEDSPYLVDTSGDVPKKYQLTSAPKRPLQPGAEEGEIDEKRAAADAKQMTTAAVFTATGDHIITGSNKGWVNVISTTTKEMIHSTRITSGCITYIRLTMSGRHMVVNANDRVLRSINIPDNLKEGADGNDIRLVVEHKFQDVVNRLLWNHCTFSGNGDYLTATTFKNHDIYIWERSTGVLAKILEGPKEELGTVEVISHSSPIQPKLRHLTLLLVASNPPPHRRNWSRERQNFHLGNIQSPTLVGSSPGLPRTRRKY